MTASTPSPTRFARLTVRNTMLLAVIAVGLVVCLAALLLAFWREDAPRMEESERAGIRGNPPQVSPRTRCQTCGVIEGIRVIEAKGDAARAYEFAVRLPDGSLRYSSDPQPGRWQVGDSMQLLGGDRTLSSPP